MSKLPEDRFFPVASYANNRSAVRLPPETPYEEMFKPEFWAHNAKRIKKDDIIEVRSDDGSFYAELYVRAVGPINVKVQEIFRKNLGEDVATQADRLEVKWAGPRRLWSVIRQSDKQPMKDGFHIKEDAVAWMEEHNKQMAA